MIYQGTGDGRFFLGEDVTDLVFLASLPPTLFWLPVALRPACCRSTCAQPWGRHANRNAGHKKTCSQHGQSDGRPRASHPSGAGARPGPVTPAVTRNLAGTCWGHQRSRGNQRRPQEGLGCTEPALPCPPSARRYNVT